MQSTQTLDVGWVGADSGHTQSMSTQSHAWAAIRSLIESKAKFKRNPTPECLLTGERGCFTIELAQTSKQIAEAYDLLCMKLTAAEVEPIDRLTSNAMGIVLQGRQTGYRLFIARDECGHPVATYGGSLMDLPGGEAVFIGTYAATHETCEGMGLMGQLFISGLIQAAVDAHKLNEELTLIIGDCTRASERMWNSVGRRRLCVGIGNGGFREIGFHQPPIKFNLSTGQPAEGMVVVKEHLMVRVLGEGPITKGKICDAVGGYYRWCGKRPETDFATKQAYAAYREHFDGLLEQFRVEIQEGGELAFFDADQRLKLEARELWFE